MGYVYKIINKVNNKIYIGITKYQNPKMRFYKHLAEYKTSSNYSKRPLYEAMKKYGVSNFEFHIIEKIKNSELSKREIYWINYYKSYIGFDNSNGYNATLGGDKGHNLISKQESDRIIKLYLDGCSQNYISKKTHHSLTTIQKCLKKEKIIPRKLQKKKIVQLDKQKNIIRTFDSILEANRYFNKDKHNTKINEVCKGKRKTAYGFYWKYI